MSIRLTKGDVKESINLPKYFRDLISADPSLNIEPVIVLQKRCEKLCRFLYTFPRFPSWFYCYFAYNSQGRDSDWFQSVGPSEMPLQSRSTSISHSTTGQSWTTSSWTTCCRLSRRYYRWWDQHNHRNCKAQGIIVLKYWFYEFCLNIRPFHSFNKAQSWIRKMENLNLKLPSALQKWVGSFQKITIKSLR